MLRSGSKLPRVGAMRKKKKILFSLLITKLVSSANKTDLTELLKILGNHLYCTMLALPCSVLPNSCTGYATRIVDPFITIPDHT
jgi:hypothetical protein